MVYHNVILAFTNPTTFSYSEIDWGRMEKGIVVVDANEEQCQKLCAVLKRHHYRTTALDSLHNLERSIQGSACQAVILDLDTVSVDNRIIRDLKRKNPGVYIVALSIRQFHPELKEAISSHIYACLGKPVDPDELIYWLRSIYEEEVDPKNPPEV